VKNGIPLHLVYVQRLLDKAPKCCHSSKTTQLIHHHLRSNYLEVFREAGTVGWHGQRGAWAHYGVDHGPQFWTAIKGPTRDL